MVRSGWPVWYSPSKKRLEQLCQVDSSNLCTKPRSSVFHTQLRVSDFPGLERWLST